MRRSSSLLVVCCMLGSIACGGSHATAPDGGPGSGSDGEAPPPTDGAVDEGESGLAEVDVPITVVAEGTHGSKMFSIPIEVGGTALDVWFDTGSSGLRILPGTLPASAFASMSSTSVTYSYSSGVELEGVVAEAVVTIGGISTPAPIPVMQVQTVTCIASKPDCDTTAPFGAYQAILGAGFRTTASAQGVGSPVAQLAGHPPFVVDVAAYTSSAGVLRLAPGAATVTPFHLFSLPALSDGVPLPDGTPAWDDHGLPICIAGYPAGTSYCEGGVLDTGEPPAYIAWASYTSSTPTVFPSGTQVSVSIGPDAGVGSYAFTVGATPTPGIDEVELETPLSTAYINLGTAVFFHDAAYFDPLHGIVGLAAH